MASMNFEWAFMGYQDSLGVRVECLNIQAFYRMPGCSCQTFYRMTDQLGIL